MLWRCVERRTIRRGGEKVACRNHSKDEYRIWYIIMKIFRSPVLLCRFTKKPPTQGVILDEDDYPII